jgi:P-type Cu+ transporter
LSSILAANARYQQLERLLKENAGASDMFTDPVCEMRVDETTSTIDAEYNGKTYYFCSEECKERFQTDPAPYANKVA